MLGEESPGQMIKVLAEDVTDPTKGSCVTEYEISMEEMEEVMDKHADKIMSQTLMSKSTLYFPGGRVVEYTWDEKENCIYKRVGKLKDKKDDA